MAHPTPTVYILSQYKKGLYVDGHEREDVVKYRMEYLLPVMAVLVLLMYTYEVCVCTLGLWSVLFP
jgi:hypothetical protein